MNSLQYKSIQVFLSQIIDYAGLYPPASLPLEEAIRNFVKYQNGPEAWMLSRFIVPATRLVELSQLAGLVFPGDVVLPLSVLGRNGIDVNDFLQNVNLDISDIQTFRKLHVEGVTVEMFEVGIPESVLADPFVTLEVVNKTADALNKNGMTVFFEAPFGENWQGNAEKLIRALRKIKDKHVGFKIRTGGVTPEAFPNPDQVAWAIGTTLDAGVPLKATAGLHHPIRQYNESVSAKMHGFLNVFGAGVLASANNLSLVQIQAILEDEDAASFVFDETGLSWKQIRASNEQIAQARLSVTSFGSCSFDEPREDLQTLGLIKLGRN